MRTRCDSLRPLLAAHGIQLRDDVLDDGRHSLVDSLPATPARSTETTVRLRRAPDDAERKVGTGKERARRAIPR